MNRLLLTLVLPAALFAQQPLIKEILVNGQTRTVQNNTVTLDAADNLTILFRVRPDASYVYQLENEDEEFVRRDYPIATYPSLKKGQYTFQIYDEFNQAQPLQVVVQDSLLSTWWFVPPLVLYLLLLFGGARYFIVLANFRNKEKVHDLRNDWTNKLHNDIGGDLSSVSVRLEILKKKLADVEPKVRDNVLKTYAILTTIQKKLRFVFDLVDPNKNSLHVMLNDVEDYAKESLALKNIELDYENNLQETETYKVDIGRINKLYLAMKEVVNNCMKYSEATLATIHIHPEKEGIRVAMSDNGKGFDPDNLPRGNGIKSLRQYAQEGFMDITIDAAPGEGTRITILAPEL